VKFVTFIAVTSLLIPFGQALENSLDIRVLDVSGRKEGYNQSNLGAQNGSIVKSQLCTE
jgi:hypothetical protein